MECIFQDRQNHSSHSTVHKSNYAATSCIKPERKREEGKNEGEGGCKHLWWTALTRAHLGQTPETEWWGGGRRAGLWGDTHSRLLAHQSRVPCASFPQRLPQPEIKLFLLIGKSRAGRDPESRNRRWWVRWCQHSSLSVNSSVLLNVIN